MSKVTNVLVPCVTLLGLMAATADLRAETHRFVPTVFYKTLSSAHPPALRIKSGDRVITTTVDDVGMDSEGTTGPFYVEGAEAGDLLVVSIDKIDPKVTVGRSTGVMVSNSLENAAALASNKDKTRVPWTIDKVNGIVRLDLQAVIPQTDWRSRFSPPIFEMPLRPMLGTVGVAPPGATAEDGGPGPSGGHLGYAGVTAGTKVMLLVTEPGALLFLGHGQARQGDGGITGSGVEASMDVEFTVELVKKKEWPHSSVVRPSTVVGEFEMAWPRLETNDYLMTLGTAPSLQQALQAATLELHHWLDDDFGLSEKSVSIFVGQAMEYEIANIADKNVTVVAKVRRSYLPPVAAK